MSWRVASLTRPKAGETENGDGVVVRSAEGTTLVALVDGLGHGPPAAIVVEAARRCLEGASLAQGVEGLMQLLHGALAGTRGAAMILCSLGEDHLEACAVGNVFFRCEPTRVPSVIGEGVVGVRLRRLRSFSSKVNKADRIVLHSDGVAPYFSFSDFHALSPDEACRDIMKRHGSPQDDATVIVIDGE